MKVSLNPKGKGINGVFAKRKILRQFNVNVSVFETQRALRSCKVISVPVPSIVECVRVLQHITFLSKKNKGQQKLERKQHTLRYSFRGATVNHEITSDFCTDPNFPLN